VAQPRVHKPEADGSAGFGNLISRRASGSRRTSQHRAAEAGLLATEILHDFRYVRLVGSETRVELRSEVAADEGASSRPSNPRTKKTRPLPAAFQCLILWAMNHLNVE
jgi:hypothetical protein